MHLGLYRTTLAAAAARLLNEFGGPRVGKNSNRSLRSRAAGGNSHIKISEKERGKLQSMNSSNYEKEFPPLSNVKSKRRTRIDLVTCSKQNSEEVWHNVPSQDKASASTSDYYDTDLPTGFGKKPSSSSRYPKPRQTYHEHPEAKKRSKPSSSTRMDEPFDICPPETTDSTSYVNERNRRTLSPTRRSAEESEHNKSVTGEKRYISEYPVEESGFVLRPGMVLLKHYIHLLEQVNIVNKCRELGYGQGGFYRPGYNDGAKLRLYMMCLGLDWNPQTKSYGDRRHHDSTAPPHLPHEFTSLVCRALDDSHVIIERGGSRNLKVANVEEILPKMSPDVCIVNFYTTNGRLGLHQDRDESHESLDKGLPVVSISIGDSAEFLFGDERDVNKAERVLLESGDILIFGGESRHIFHGVKTIIPGTAPSALLETTRLLPGRLNLTFRKY